MLFRSFVRRLNYGWQKVLALRSLACATLGLLMSHTLILDEAAAAKVDFRQQRTHLIARQVTLPAFRWNPLCHL